MIPAETLNSVARLLGTTDKNVVISACIAGLVQEGADIREAVDFVLGEGAFRSIAGDVYHALRARHAAAH